MKKVFLTLALVLAVATSGCSSFGSQPIEFQTTASASFKLNPNTFDSIELHPSDISLWRDGNIVGSITTMPTAPDFESAIDELKQGLLEAQKGPGVPQLLDLPNNAYGFSSTHNGFTTAFIASSASPETWVTISAQAELFDQMLATIRFE